MNIHGTATRVSVVHDSEMGIQTTNLHAVGLGKNSVQTQKINLHDVSQITIHLEHADGAITFLSFLHSHRVDKSVAVLPSIIPSMVPSRSPSDLSSQEPLPSTE
jgi:hypothetical protein